MPYNKNNNKKFILVIGGPTASGKTKVALHLASYFKAHIFSADSRQVYKELTIGTAKPDPYMLESIPHHFINHISISAYYSAGMFEKELKAKLEDYCTTSDVAIVAGGTGLYLKALSEGFDELPQADPAIMEELQYIFQSEGIQRLQEMLAEKDPVYYQKADIQNPHRLLRALHVTLSAGKPYSSFLGKEKKSPLPYEIIGVYLDPPREILYQAINTRVDEMMAAGLEKEAEGLIAYEHHQALQTVGYAELFRYFKGEITRKEAVELIKQNSRRYAKRQVTWFKKFGKGQWFTEPDEEAILTYILEQMKK